MLLDYITSVLDLIEACQDHSFNTRSTKRVKLTAFNKILPRLSF
ncbi:hypothetical protein BpHYR1_038063 [Brachionus plicatilis]|uniref:Uncharacterized protein n=1 Tax=Brachionus plicatilis TaxID=10195 RepID=A0A3M7R4U2_BRAPC|nr:hypothetical protein BpHYR1_038063 [Brachionus plicatilis]